MGVQPENGGNKNGGGSGGCGGFVTAFQTAFQVAFALIAGLGITFTLFYFFFWNS